MKYCKKQVVIDAMQWDGTWECALVIKNDFMGGEATVTQENGGPVTFIIPTLEGQHIASPHDYIIKGVKGEFYPCKPDIFELTYENVEVQDD
jgi:hypothetical protein